MRDIKKLRALKEKFGMKFFDPTTYAKGSPEYKKIGMGSRLCYKTYWN